jgi:hypothetical protein
MGSFYFAPCLHAWYCKILPKIGDKLFSTSTKTVRVIGSMLFDQLAFAPILLSGFFTFNGLLI